MKLPPFQELLDAHREDVYRFLVASVGSNDAEDCFQETFMAALSAYPKVAEATNLRGWLFTIAHHKAIDLHRRRKRQGIPSGDFLDLSTGFEPAVVDRDLWIRVQALPARQRSAIVLRFVDDLAYQTIGEVIGCSESAARQNVRAGLARLREEIKE
ncbi:MAG: RNA polymerase sigma factor [Acidimicrobiia bacterium]|nr:RNA polymerase sigma factor [Acidimicrobiia bacterium]